MWVNATWSRKKVDTQYNIGKKRSKHALCGVFEGDGQGAMATHAVSHDAGSRQVQLVRELGCQQCRELLQMWEEGG